MKWNLFTSKQQPNYVSFLDTACRTLRLMNSQTNTWLCTQCHQQQKKASLLEEHFEAVEEEDEKAIGGSDASSASEL